MKTQTLNQNWPPHITVAAVIHRDNKFLMVEENSDNRIVYNQPAGHLEPNETPLSAIIRETLEETAWYFVPKAIVGFYLYRSPENNITYLRICFTGEVSHQEAVQKLDVGIIRTLWLSRQELKDKTEKLRSPMVLKCIDDYLANQHYPLDLITDFRFS